VDSNNELSYVLDTFYLLVCGALVMWMAAGFTMLEAGLVRAKNTTSILTKNIALYSLASVTFLLCGYQIMYGTPVNGFVPGLGAGVGEENDVAAVLWMVGRVIPDDWEADAAQQEAEAITAKPDAAVEVAARIVASMSN